MCYYITLAVPSEYSETVSRFKTCGFRPSPVSNSSVLALLPPGHKTFLVTSGMCSCDLYFPEPADRPSSKSPERLRKKYAKKGWSEAKILRALQNCEKAYSHTEYETGFAEDLLLAFTELAEQVGRFAVFVHWYRGNVET